MDYVDIIDRITKSQGFHRSNQFKVEFEPPNVMSNTQQNRKIHMNCFSAPLPGYAIENHNHSYSGGTDRKHTNTVNYNDITLGFYVSKDFLEHQYFIDWRDNMSTKENQMLSWYDDYVTDIIITPMKNSGTNKDLKPFTLIEAKPTTVGDVDLSWENENQISKMLVSFSYRLHDLG